MHTLTRLIWLLLLSTPALALAQSAEGEMSETVSLIWVVVFAVLFVGSIAGFLLYMWYRERKNSSAEGTTDS